MKVLDSRSSEPTFHVVLQSKPVQYREVQGNESRRFLSYLPHFTSLQRGAETGFQHVEPDSPLELNHLYQIAAVLPVSRREIGTQVPLSSANISVRQVTPTAESLNKGDVFILDRGTSILQLYTRASSGKEKLAAAEFVEKLIVWARRPSTTDRLW